MLLMIIEMYFCLGLSRNHFKSYLDILTHSPFVDPPGQVLHSPYWFMDDPFEINYSNLVELLIFEDALLIDSIRYILTCVEKK